MQLIINGRNVPPEEVVEAFTGHQATLAKTFSTSKDPTLYQAWVDFLVKHGDFIQRWIHDAIGDTSRDIKHVLTFTVRESDNSLYKEMKHTIYLGEEHFTIHIDCVNETVTYTHNLTPERVDHITQIKYKE